MYDAKAIGRRVRSKCVDHGITYKDLANALGVSEGTVKSWVYGERAMSLENAWQIADYFSIPMDELIRRTVPGKQAVVA